MSTLIKGAKFLRHSGTILICTILAGAVVWRALTYEFSPDPATFTICVLLAICLIFTGIAATDKSAS